MCNPLLLAGVGAAQSALQIVSVNKTVEAQTESVQNQMQAEYAQAAYDNRKQAEAAIDEGYKADIEKRQAVGKAMVRNAALGIRGNTAGDVVAEEVQVGNYNIAGAKEQRRNADTAYTIGTAMTYSNGKEQIKSIQAQAPTMFESILAIGAGGLQGYMTGLDVKDALSGVPEGL